MSELSRGSIVDVPAETIRVPTERAVSAERVVAVLNPHGDNRAVVAEALQRALAGGLDIALVVLAELRMTQAPAMATVDVARQQVIASDAHTTVRTYLSWENCDGWADRIGAGVAAVVVSTAIVHGVSQPSVLPDGGSLLVVVDEWTATPQTAC